MKRRAEATGQSLYTILLDWEKAFDKIHPDALLTALTRYGVPQHLTTLIKNIYTSPQLTVSAAGKQSTTAEASSGIRQGCPLSPYLFFIVHGMVMHDVDQKLTANGEFLHWLYSQNQPFYDLAHADDTALIAGTAKRAEQLLHTLQQVAAHSNPPPEPEEVRTATLPYLTQHGPLHQRHPTHHRATRQIPRSHSQQRRFLTTGTSPHVSQKHANTLTHYTNSIETQTSL